MCVVGPTTIRVKGCGQNYHVLIWCSSKCTELYPRLTFSFVVGKYPSIHSDQTDALS